MEHEYPGDEVFDRIEELCERGDEYMEIEKYRPALKKFWKAFDLLPEPKTQYPAGTWLLVSIGDINFQVGNYKGGVETLNRAKTFFEAADNPFLHFRLAQCCFEEGDNASAIKEFELAFAEDGAAIFEDEDPKYWSFFEANRLEGIKPKND